MTDFSADNWERLASAAGKVTLAWGSIHGTVFGIFWMTSGMSQELAEDVYISIRSDRLQREIALRSAARFLADREEVRSALKSIFRKIDNLASDRNSVVHTIWQKLEWQHEGGPPRQHVWISSPHPQRKSSYTFDLTNQFVAKFGKAESELWKISSELKKINAQILELHIDRLKDQREKDPQQKDQ